ncbi:MAG: DUF192 domain-containing protein [Rhodospirillales bacterium]|nr:DUF192 domain-containing protein [Rhodospirillales bacterium]
MVLFMGLVCFHGLAYSGQNQAVTFELSELTVVTANDRHHFRIEVAKTRVAHARGLMERQHMDDDAGMLFDFVKPQQIHMWMKNTFIPLDMLFIDSSGIIVGIAANTTPQSLAVIASPGPALAVLELNGGTALLLRITVGDRVEHEMF